MSQINSGLSPKAIERRMAEARAALKRMQDNPRITKIVISVPHDACQACRELAGTYEKDNVPEIHSRHRIIPADLPRRRSG